MATIGLETKGATEQGTPGYGMCSKATTDASGGTTSKISVYLNNTGDIAHTCLVCIYADDGGAPGAQLAAEVEVTVAAHTEGWFDATYEVVLSPSTQYWIALEGDSAIGYFYNSVSVGSNYADVGGYDLPATFPASTSLDRQYSIHADYAAASGGVAVKAILAARRHRG